MTKYTPPIRRRNTRWGHVYEDALGRPVPGVTTIKDKGYPKPWGIPWAAGSVAEAAINRWDELGEMPVAQRLKTLKAAPYADRDEAARRGTEVHALAEKLIVGERVTVPDAIAGHVDAYLKFLKDWEPEALLIEAVVANYSVGYAGTLDGILDFSRHGRLLTDIKTNRTDVYGDVAYQLAPYRYAEIYVDADGNEQPMIPVDGCAVLHIRSDGYSLRPVEVGPAQFRAFRYIYETMKAEAESANLIGDELTPPSGGLA